MPSTPLGLDKQPSGHYGVRQKDNKVGPLTMQLDGLTQHMRQQSDYIIHQVPSKGYDMEKHHNITYNG